MSFSSSMIRTFLAMFFSPAPFYWTEKYSASAALASGVSIRTSTPRIGSRRSGLSSERIMQSTRSGSWRASSSDVAHSTSFGLALPRAKQRYSTANPPVSPPWRAIVPRARSAFSDRRNLPMLAVFAANGCQQTGTQLFYKPLRQNRK